MADTDNNTPQLPDNGGDKNSSDGKKEYDILNPEAKAENNEKKGIVEKAQNFVETGKKVVNLVKKAPGLIIKAGPVGLVVLVIIFIIGLIGFVLYMPGLIVNKLKDFAQGALDTVESWFTTEADAYINEDDLLTLANYLEEMDYDLVGYGFIIPEESEYITEEELQEQGYYYDTRGDVTYPRYFEESAEDDPDGDSVYSDYYYNSEGELINNKTGTQVEGTYTDQYGLERDTEETNSNGDSLITGFNSVDTTLLRTYLLSDYRIYVIRNGEEGILSTIYSAIKRTFGGYSSAWSKGLLKFYNASGGIATSTWSDSFIFGEDISINLYSSGTTTMTIKSGVFNNAMTFDIDGWADRYGMSLEFLLSLQIATMQPDLVYAMLQSFDTEVQVYLEESGDAEVSAEYVDMMNSDTTVTNGLTLTDIEEAFEKTGHGITSFFANNDNSLLDYIAQASVTRKSAKDVYDYINNTMGLSLKSPPNCTGQAEDQIIVLATDDLVYDSIIKARWQVIIYIWAY